MRSCPLTYSAAGKGSSSGSNCRSLSISITAEPRDSERATVTAVSCPEFFEGSIALWTAGSWANISFNLFEVPSVLPSLTKMISYGRAIFSSVAESRP